MTRWAPTLREIIAAVRADNLDAARITRADVEDRIYAKADIEVYRRAWCANLNAARYNRERPVHEHRWTVVPLRVARPIIARRSQLTARFTEQWAGDSGWAVLLLRQP